MRKDQRCITSERGVPSPSMGVKPDEYVTSPEMFNEVFEPMIEKVGLEMAGAFNDFNGPITLIAERAALSLGATPEAMQRYIRRVRKLECRAVSTEYAETLLLTQGVFITQTDLPTFPGGLGGALEMVDIYHEDRDEEITELERHRLAQMLLGLARGFLADTSLDPLPDTETFARQVAGSRLRSSYHWRQIKRGRAA